MTTNIEVRNYSKDTDLVDAVKIYNSNNYLFERNAQLLEHFIKYPGVTKDSIFTVVIDNDISGIAILSIAQKGGLKVCNILELLAKNHLSAELLINKAEEFCANKRVDIVSIRPIMDEKNKKKLMSGWIKDNNYVMMAKPISMLPILKSLLSANILNMYIPKHRLIIEFEEETIEIEFDNKKMEISNFNGDISKSDIILSINIKTFLKIVSGKSNPYLEYTLCNIKLNSFKYVFPILRLLSSIQLSLNNISIIDGL